MYLVMVLGLMIVLPVVSIVVEMVRSASSADLLPVAAKWFVFWSAGVRLLAAGIKQVLQPSFTASTIFKIGDPAAEKLVTEIGFGNLAMGLVATLSLLIPAWVVPAGLAGGLYLGLAGLKHVANRDRTREENLAMTTDLVVALVIGVTIIGAILR